MSVIVTLKVQDFSRLIIGYTMTFVLLLLPFLTYSC